MTTRSAQGGSAQKRSAREGSAREEAAAVLARAIEERRTANARLAARTRVEGFHGEDFEKRWPRVESIVKTHNDKAARAAWERALRTGWTQAELHRSGFVIGEDT